MQKNMFEAFKTLVLEGWTIRAIRTSLEARGFDLSECSDPFLIYEVRSILKEAVS